MQYSERREPNHTTNTQKDTTPIGPFAESGVGRVNLLRDCTVKNIVIEIC